MSALSDLIHAAFGDSRRDRIASLEVELSAVKYDRDMKAHALMLVRDELEAVDAAISPFRWMAPPWALTSDVVKAICRAVAEVQR